MTTRRSRCQRLLASTLVGDSLADVFRARLLARLNVDAEVMESLLSDSAAAAVITFNWFVTFFDFFLTTYANIFSVKTQQEKEKELVTVN